MLGGGLLAGAGKALVLLRAIPDPSAPAKSRRRSAGSDPTARRRTHHELSGPAVQPTNQRRLSEQQTGHCSVERTAAQSRDPGCSSRIIQERLLAQAKARAGHAVSGLRDWCWVESQQFHTKSDITAGPTTSAFHQKRQVVQETNKPLHRPKTLKQRKTMTQAISPTKHKSRSKTQSHIILAIAKKAAKPRKISCKRSSPKPDSSEVSFQEQVIRKFLR